MRMLFFLMLLTILSDGAYADWKKITSNKFSTYYIDVNRTRRMSKNVVRTWILADNKFLSGGKDYLSDIRLIELDCYQQAVRELASTDYSGAMGTGSRIRSSNFITNWDFAPPNSSMEDMLSFGCSIR